MKVTAVVLTPNWQGAQGGNKVKDGKGTALASQLAKCDRPSQGCDQGIGAQPA